MAHWTDINELLSTYSQGWPLERMPSVDRAILRLGAFEVLYGEGVPEGVAIAEAVELAQSLSTDDSPEVRQRPAGAPGGGQADPGVSARRLHNGFRHGRVRRAGPRGCAARWPTGDGGALCGSAGEAARVLSVRHPLTTCPVRQGRRS